MKTYIPRNGVGTWVSINEIKDHVESKVQKSYNIGSGRNATINELAQLILKLTGRTDLKPTYAPPRHGDIRQSAADITKARKQLSFKPNMSLNNGIKMLLTLKNI